MIYYYTNIMLRNQKEEKNSLCSTSLHLKAPGMICQSVLCAYGSESFNMFQQHIKHCDWAGPYWLCEQACDLYVYRQYCDSTEAHTPP